MGVFLVLLVFLAIVGGGLVQRITNRTKITKKTNIYRGGVKSLNDHLEDPPYQWLRDPQ